MIQFLTLVLLFLPASAAAGQAPSPAPDVACAVEPRSVDDLIELWFSPDGSPKRATPPDSQLRSMALDPSLGEPAGDEVATEVERVMREWIACLNGGDLLRLHALMTDEFVIARGSLVDTPERARAALGVEPSPAASGAHASTGPAIGARQFADGRTGAFFAVTGLREPGESWSTFVLFDEMDGQWRIDGLESFVMAPPLAPVSGFHVLATYPHDPDAYTQGLVFIDGVLYEGTGQRGESELRQVNLETGTVEQSYALDDELFGEGVVGFGDRIYQITWQAEVAFVYDRETFELLETFSYQGEGWGLTTDGEWLIMSDGSDRLFFRDPETFEVLDTVAVRDAGLPVSNLNELEYIDGEVWANVYQTNWIVRIDPVSGEAIGWVDLDGLRPVGEPGWENAEVLNGIAWDADGRRLLVTGKDWPALFEIELVPPV